MGRTKGSKNGVRKVPLKKPKFKYELQLKLETFSENIDSLKSSLPIFDESVLNAYGNKRYRKCIDLIEKILENKTDDNKDHYKILQAASYTMLKENFDEAHSVLDEVLLSDPSSSFAMYGKGVAFYFERKLDESVVWLNKAIEINPGEQMERAKDMKMRIDLERRKAVIRIEKMNGRDETSDIDLPEEIETLLEEFNVTIDGDRFNDLELFDGERDDDRFSDLKLEEIQAPNSSQSYESPNDEIRDENMAIDEDPLEISGPDKKTAISKSPQPSIVNDDDDDGSLKHKPTLRERPKPAKPSSPTAEETFAKAMELYKTGSLKKALKLFGKAFKMDPLLTEADEMGMKTQELLELMDVAATNMSQKNYAAVIEILSEALVIDQTNDHVNRPFFFQRGLAYFHLGKNKESIKDYAKFESINKLLTKN